MAETIEFQRENRLGMKYLIREISHKETVIQLKGTEKGYLLKVPTPTILAAWFNWQFKDMYIQEAFDFLNEDEREFIQSGLLPGEWNEIFDEIEERNK